MRDLCGLRGKILRSLVPSRSVYYDEGSTANVGPPPTQETGPSLHELMSNGTVEDVRSASHGDLQAFERLVEYHRDGIYGLCYAQVGDFHDAEDLAQETFVRAFVKLGTLNEPAAFAAWLTRIARNICLDWLRAKRCRERTELAADCGATAQALVRDDTPQIEAQDAASHALSHLPESQRLAAALYYVNGYSYDEVARFLSTSRTVVKGRIQRARQKLRKEVTKMVADQFTKRRPKPGFTREVLEQAVERAKKAHRRWDSDELDLAKQEAESALVSLEDEALAHKLEIELFTILGDAAAGWLGEPKKGLAHYRRALAAAREIEDDRARAAALKAIVVACCRHGRYADLAKTAGEGMEAFEATDDRTGVTLMAAAAQLAELLPSRWRTGKEGGFSFGVFPVERYRGGLRLLTPDGIRDFTWGGPSRSAALVFLCYPRRILNSSPRVGSQWRDEVDTADVYCSWGFMHGSAADRFRATSKVESDSDIVYTLAGRFRDCLRVRTRMSPAGGGKATEFSARACCGDRTAWFAPGVGLVKLRHEDQNGKLRVLRLAEHHGPKGNEAHFPLDEGRRWHYRWWDEHHCAFFDDICTVARADARTSLIASAVAAAPAGDKEAEQFFKNTAAFDKKSGHIEDSIASLTATIPRLHSAGREALKGRLARLRDKLAGRPGGQAAEPDETEPKEPKPSEEDLRQRIDAFEREGRQRLVAGDFDSATNCFAVALGCEERLRNPDLSEDALAHGGERVELSRRCFRGRGCGLGSRPSWPGRQADSHMWSLSSLGLPDVKLPPKMGEETCHGTNHGVGVGVETFIARSRVVAVDPPVKVPAGSFEGCLVVESTIATSREKQEYGQKERERARGYFGGRRRVWFAPGVGLVRLRYAHANGLVTDVRLAEYSVKRSGKQWFPYAPGNTWRYEWSDPATGIRFEEVVRAVEKKGDRVMLARVVSAMRDANLTGRRRT